MMDWRWYEGREGEGECGEGEGEGECGEDARKHTDGYPSLVIYT